MELKWLEDFVTLAESGSFSKAAATRHVTQPAFSRRIRALEAWLGVSLVDRSTFPAQITDSGNEFLKFAHRMIFEIRRQSSYLRSKSSSNTRIVIRSQHSLAVSFLPKWLRDLRAVFQDTIVEVQADNLYDAVNAFQTGSGHFLLCYASENEVVEIERHHFPYINLGEERLVPVAAANYYVVNSTDVLPTVRLLGYPNSSYFGRIIDRLCIRPLRSEISFVQEYESAFVEVIKELCLDGCGVAWLPKSLIEDELATNRLHIIAKPMKSVVLGVRFYYSTFCSSRAGQLIWTKLVSRYVDG